MVTNTEQIRWQSQAVRLLTSMLKLASAKGLPPISWRVADVGSSLIGECQSLPFAPRREDFEAWRAAITSATGQAPDADHEHAFSSQETRLVASWERVPVKLRAPAGSLPFRATLALAASIWPDEDQDQESQQ